MTDEVEADRVQSEAGIAVPQGFRSLEPDASAGEPGMPGANLDLILDVPVTLSMEVGRARMSIRTLLELRQGSVVELDRMSGAPMDVFVNGTLIAHGEVVVVNERFGLRLIDVVSPRDRLRKLA